MTKLVKVCTLVHILRYSRIARAQTYDRVVPYTSHTVRGSGLYPVSPHDATRSYVLDARACA